MAWYDLNKSFEVDATHCMSKIFKLFISRKSGPPCRKIADIRFQARKRVKNIHIALWAIAQNEVEYPYPLNMLKHIMLMFHWFKIHYYISYYRTGKVHCLRRSNNSTTFSAPPLKSVQKWITLTYTCGRATYKQAANTHRISVWARWTSEATVPRKTNGKIEGFDGWCRSRVN